MASTKEVSNVWWVVGLQLEISDRSSSDFIELLRQHGVQARPFFYPLHLQPALARYFPKGLPKKSLPEGKCAERLYEKGLYLPGGNGLTLAKVGEVCDRFRRALVELN